MPEAAKTIQTTYVRLTLLNTLAASFIWGVNTLFLLDAGLNNTQAFAANAFFTAGQVIFEVPTGVIADTLGRRFSYLVGCITLLSSTLLYLYLWHIMAPFWAWALVSALLGLGFTFFSGAVEAWLVDALHFSGFKGAVENVFAKGQIATGVAMLTGSVAGGIVAQVSNLGVPYILRAAVLGISFAYAFIIMRDLGFEPARTRHPLKEMKKIFLSSIEHGLKNRKVRWIMLAAPFTTGVGFYAFYAMQPYLLKLWGDETAYAIAGLAAAIVAGAQILGGLAVPKIRKFFARRTSLIMFNIVAASIILVAIGLSNSFWLAIFLLVLWALIFATTSPVRQAYLNGVIPSKQRATIISFDSLFGSTGGVVSQPILGRAADVWSYSASFVLSGVINILALPFVAIARRQKAESDPIESE